MDSTHNFDDFFEHKTLQQIHGEPNTKSLQTLFKQLRKNARSVNSTLGGGQYGHLFMVISEEEWNNLPGTTPVIIPHDPGPFLLDGRTRPAEISVAEKNHEDQRKKYLKFQALQRILKNQLVSAIDPAFLDPIRCELTDMVTQPIADIIKFLQDTYGRMTINQIEEATTNIKNFSYDPSTSINILLTAIQEHVDLMRIAGTALQDKQVQDLAYYMINKYQIFKEALINWNKTPQPKTWELFKEHMRKEYQMLKDVNALTIQEAALNTTDIVAELKYQQENLLETAEKRFKNGLTEVMNLAIMDFEKDKEPKENYQEQANNTAEINFLKQEIKRLNSQLQNRGNSFNSNPTNRFNTNRRQNTNQRFEKQFYCWTHGAGHSGWNCRNPAEGHQPEATFQNRMGGNNYGCYNSRPRRFNNFNNNNFNNRRPRFTNNNNNTTATNNDTIQK